MKDGNILMSVHTQDSRERDRAKEIFTDGGAEDISYTGEEGVPEATGGCPAAESLGRARPQRGD